MAPFFRNLGNGNSIAPKSCSNTDIIDSLFEYSKITEAEYTPPLVYGLAQNYPNPLNPSTKISFAVPKLLFFSVKVYNVFGNQAAVLFNGTASAGKTYDLLVDGL